MARKTRATIEDLYRVPEDRKAEIIQGALVPMAPTGAASNRAAGEVFASLREYARRNKRGRAVTDHAGFKVSRATDPDTPTIRHRGQLAEAEPAVPGWTMPVDDLFA